MPLSPRWNSETPLVPKSEFELSTIVGNTLQDGIIDIGDVEHATFIERLIGQETERVFPGLSCRMVFSMNEISYRVFTTDTYFRDTVILQSSAIDPNTNNFWQSSPLPNPTLLLICAWVNKMIDDTQDLHHIFLEGFCPEAMVNVATGIRYVNLMMGS